MRGTCALGAVPILLVVFLTGCGSGGDKPTASVTGKVVYDGQPVTEGTLHFSPVAEGALPGKAGAGEVAADGTYSVSTYSDGDGAVIGSHEVSYTAPPPRPKATENGEAGSGHDADEGPSIPSEFDGLVPKTTRVEVESGGSVVNVELVKP